MILRFNRFDAFSRVINAFGCFSWMWTWLMLWDFVRGYVSYERSEDLAATIALNGILQTGCQIPLKNTMSSYRHFPFNENGMSHNARIFCDWWQRLASLKMPHRNKRSLFSPTLEVLPSSEEFITLNMHIWERHSFMDYNYSRNHFLDCWWNQFQLFSLSICCIIVEIHSSVIQ